MRPTSPLPRFLLLVAALVTATALLAGCGGDEDDGNSSSGPRQLLEEAATKPIESAQVDMRLGANVPGFPILGSRLSLIGQGPFKSNGRDALPTLDWRVKFTADDQVFPVRLRAVDDRMFVDFMGLSYEADPELIGDLGRGDDEQSSGRGGTSLEQLGVHPADWLRRLRVEDGEEIGGDSTRKITGAVNVPAVVDDLVEALESSGIAEQLGQDNEDAAKLTELSGEDRRKLEGAIKDAEVEVNVDDEGYARRAYAKLSFEMPKDVKGTNIERGTITFDLVLEQIGDVDVQVSPPASPRDLDSLFRLVGIVFGIDEVSDLWRKPN